MLDQADETSFPTENRRFSDDLTLSSPSKNQKSSKVNMKSTICHDSPSLDLLEGPKDGKIKENGKSCSF